MGALEDRHAVTDGGVKGPLKVVAPVALGQLQLADVALRFQMRYPRVALTWQLEDHPIRFAEVGCDCWIKVGPVPDETLIVRRLARVERLVVASPDLIGDRPISGPDDVTGLPFIALSPYEGCRVGLTSAKGTKTDIAPNVRISTNNILAAHRGAVMGAGAAILPRWFIENDLASGRLVDLLTDWRAATLDINAAYLPARHQPKRLALFLDVVEQGVREIPGVNGAETTDDKKIQA